VCRRGVTYPETVTDGGQLFADVSFGDVARSHVHVQSLIERLSVGLERQRQRRKLLLHRVPPHTASHHTHTQHGSVIALSLYSRLAGIQFEVF